MLCESESSGVRRGVSRPCKSGNCVVYWSQSSKKRPSIDCRPSPISAAHRHTPPFHEPSEERRVGTECVSTCTSRWSPSHSTQTPTHHLPPPPPTPTPPT